MNHPIARRFKEWRKSRADERLFGHLCQVFRLEREEAQMLIELADAHELVRLSEIFVRPGLFATDRRPPQLAAENVARLARRIFERAPGAAG